MLSKCFDVEWRHIYTKHFTNDTTAMDPIQQPSLRVHVLNTYTPLFLNQLVSATTKQTSLSWIEFLHYRCF